MQASRPGGAGRTDPAAAAGARAGAGRRWALAAAGLFVALAGCSGDARRVEERVSATRGLDPLDEDPAALPRYGDILARMRPDRLTPAERLTRAVFYYRFHRMKALDHLHALPEAERTRLKPLFDLEARHGRDADLLWLAFAEAGAVAGEANVDRTQVPEWVLEERERIFGDYFRTRADQGVLDPGEFSAQLPAALARELERTCFLQLAAAYYGMGWQRAVSFGRPQDTHRAAVIGTLEALARSSEAIGALPGRAAEFAADQVILAATYRHQAESVMSAASPKAAGLLVPSEFAIFESTYHYRESRERMAMAITELNERMGARAIRFFLDALKHLVFAQELARARPLVHPDEGPTVADQENSRTAVEYLQVIFSNVDRITAGEG